MLRSLVTLGRPSALVTSVALHAAAIAAGGHSAAESAARSIGIEPIAQVTVDIDLEPAPVVAPPALQERPEPPVERAARPPVSPHRHPYPVSPSHDAHPHDPSIVHVPLAPAADPAPAAAPSIVEAHPEAPVRFVLPAGNSAVSGTHVASNAGIEGPATSSGEPAVTYDESEVSVPARLVASTPPAYPAEALADQIEADVTLELVVDASGRVVEARSGAEAGHGLDRAAVRAVRGYRFSPALRRGRPVTIRMRWTVQFRLR